jgi:hypothetical protein
VDGFIGLAAVGIAILLFVGANIVAVAFVMAGPAADAGAPPRISTDGRRGTPTRRG